MISNRINLRSDYIWVSFDFDFGSDHYLVDYGLLRVWFNKLVLHFKFTLNLFILMSDKI